jgi:hypothetical protein
LQFAQRRSKRSSQRATALEPFVNALERRRFDPARPAGFANGLPPEGVLPARKLV